jgi:ankyrin repeat protein
LINPTSLVHSIEPETQENNSTNKNDNIFSISLYDSLFNAIEVDNYSEVKLFIEFGADVNYRYTNGKTPLMIASSLGSINVIKILLALGADADLKSNEKMNAMDYAHQTNDKLVITTLTTSISIKSKNSNDIIIAEDIPVAN